MKLAPFAFAAAVLFAGPALAQNPAYDGDWEGVLQVGGQQLRLELRVKTEAGATTAVLDSLDQGASLPTNLVKVENGELSAAFVQAAGELKGKLSGDGKVIDATWTQGPGALPLKLTRKGAK